MSTDDPVGVQKRFKHRSYQAQVNDVHLPSPLAQNAADQPLSDNESHFQLALDHWKQLNLSPAFLQYAKKTEQLAASLPLLLHNWQLVVDLWIEAMAEADLESKQPLLDLMQKLLHDLRTTLIPKFESIWDTLLAQATRLLSPSTLETYTQTLSACLKHLLLPTPSLASFTWDALSATMKKCRPDIRRLLAEVWGTTLRKFKSEQKRHATDALVGSLDTLSDTIAWIYITSVRSTSLTLHTAALPLLELLLENALVADDFEPIYKLVRRVLTATMHYCSVESFQPITNIFVSRIHALAEPFDEKRTQRLLRISLVIFAFRKGKQAEAMANTDQLASVLSKLSSFPLTLSLKRDVAAMIVACLKGGELALWVRGRSALEHIWKDVEAGYWVAEALSALDQSKGANWRSFILPQVQKVTVAHIASHSAATLRLLRMLVESKRIVLEDATWKKAIQKSCAKLLDEWKLNDKSSIQLHHILALVPQLPSLAPSIASIVDNIVSLDVNPIQNYMETAANASWFFGSCLLVLGEMDELPPDSKVDVWLQHALTHYSWSSPVLEGVASLAKHAANPINFVDAFEMLKASVMSHVGALRYNALRILASDLVVRDSSQDLAVTACLQAEEVEISATRAPERVLKTGKVGNAAPVGQSAGAAELCIRWLVGQFKVNLMPVWKATSQALIDVANRSSEELWDIMGPEIQAIFAGALLQDRPTWIVEDEDDREVQEEEKTWRNPGLQETLEAMKGAIQEDEVMTLVKAQVISERIDVENYEKQLLKTLEGCSSLAERHNRELIPLFLSFVSPSGAKKASGHNLASWLSLLSKFNNPRAVVSADELRATYISLLSHPDRHLQTLAVDCMLSYKSKALTTHKDTIRGLLEDSQWKEHLTGLDLGSTVQPSEREEFVEFLIRLFYGMMRERRGRNKLQERRTALINSLRQCHDSELGTLVHLMLEPFEMADSMAIDGGLQVRPLPASMTSKQQVGFLVLLAEVDRILGVKLTAYISGLLHAVTMIVANAQKVLEENRQVTEEDQDERDGDNEDENILEDVPGQLPLKVARNLRQLGIKRFTDPFRLPIEYDFRPFLPTAFSAFISCRLPAFEQENSQSPSSLMELFHVWSTHPSYAAFLADYDSRVLPKIYGCLITPNVKPVVIMRVFDIAENIFAHATTEQLIVEALVQPHTSILIDSLTVMIQESAKTGAVTSNVSHRQISVLRMISDHVRDVSQAIGLLKLLLPLLRKPSSKVNESAKVDLLQVVARLVLLLPMENPETTTLTTATFEHVSQLLQTLRGRAARTSATKVFTALGAKDPQMEKLSSVIEALNSFDPRRPEEPDFDRRMDAFTLLNEELYLHFTVSQWTPILHNMLHFIHDQNELSIRTNAAFSMRRFIERMEKVNTTEFQRLFGRVLLSGLKGGLRSKHEVVRTELISVLSYAIKQCPTLPSLEDMTPLLANGDEEANFFNNVAHIQIHRRTRALRRLAEFCDQGQLRSSTLFEIFVPIVGHYIGEENHDHLLVNEAITTLGHISRQLIWSRYYSLVQRYLKAVKDKKLPEKAAIRTVVIILDSFHFRMEEDVPEPVQEEEDGDEEGAEEIVQSVPETKIADAVNGRLLPALLNFMEKREETEDTLRLPMAVGVVKVALHLPAEKQRAQITRLITIVSQALRSKSSETRDTAREVLCKVLVSTGPSYLPVIIKELRVALTRGPQLHILAVTCHSLIHHITSDAGLANTDGILDEVAASVAEVSAEVIFGQSGKDTQGEDFKTKIREVRSASSKGLDAMTILARFVSPSVVSQLLLPLKSIMYETQAAKVMQLVDETLKRLSSGLNSNPSLDPNALLSLCHTLISQNAKFLQEKPELNRKGKKNDYVVQTKRDLPQATKHYAHNSYRFTVLGLDLLTVAFRRNRFDFHDEGIISRLEPLVSLIGNTLYSSATAVVINGLKAISSIVKAPLKSVPKSLLVITRQQVNIIRQSGSAESEVAQAALKSLATTLRECPSAQLKEQDLQFLLEFMVPDLEEPERQASVFALLRAIIQRKLVVPEIYDMMDKIANIMVTSQSTQVQEVCRGIMLQFLLDYPQGKGRLRKQMTFLASNLSYVYEPGRISVMILLDAVLLKFDSSLLSEFIDLFLAALVMVLANDESTVCKEKASGLVKKLYTVMSNEERQKTLERVHAWASQTTQASLTGVAFQVYGLAAQVAIDNIAQYLGTIVEDINHAIETALERYESLVTQDTDAMDVDLDWQVPYQALGLLSKLSKAFIDNESQRTLQTEIAWETIVDLMLFPHAWVRAAASRLLGSFYAWKISFGHQSDSHPASRAGMITVATNSSIQLRSEHLDQPFALQIVKNLVFLGKTFYGTLDATQNAEDDSEDESEDDEGGENERGELSKLERIKRAPLPWLFSKLSYQVRTAHLKRRNTFAASKKWHLEPLSVLQWFAAMVAHMEAEDLERFLNHVLTPVYRLLEDDTIRDAGMDEVKLVAQELQDLVQSKVGITKFTAAYGQIRQGALNVRRERKVARAMQVASDPQAAAKRQLQRNMAKKESRKRKSQAFREHKVSNYPSKKRRVE